MKVETISRDMLIELSYELLDKVQEDKFTPNILIGIATGGVYISRPMHEKLKEKTWQGSYYEIKLQRNSTKKKKTLRLKSLFKYLPYSLLNLLRKLEILLLEKFKTHTYNQNKEQEVQFSKVLIKDIQKSKNILLIDDAIDSGTTLLAIKNVILKINPNISIKTAVLTVTHKKPYIEADYRLFDRVLLRCPWAEDYKGEDKIV